MIFLLSHIFHLAEVPDSFFELSKMELIDFQKTLQNKSKSLYDRPFISAKEKFKKEIFVKETVNLKIIFPDQKQVQVKFSSSFKGENSITFHFLINY